MFDKSWWFSNSLGFAGAADMPVVATVKTSEKFLRTAESWPRGWTNGHGLMLVNCLFFPEKKRGEKNNIVAFFLPPPTSVCLFCPFLTGGVRSTCDTFWRCFYLGGKQKFCASITFCRPGTAGKKYEAKNSDDPAPSAFISGSFDFSTIVSNSVQKFRKKNNF